MFKGYLGYWAPTVGHNCACFSLIRYVCDTNAVATSCSPQIYWVMVCSLSLSNKQRLATETCGMCGGPGGLWLWHCLWNGLDINLDSGQGSSNKALFCSFSSLCGDVFDQIMLLLLLNIILRTKLEGAYPFKREHLKSNGEEIHYREEIETKSSPLSDCYLVSYLCLDCCAIQYTSST